MRLSRPSPWCAALLAATLATPVGLLRAQAKPAAAVPTQAKPAPAATATPPPGTNADTGWPRTIALSSGTRGLVSAADRKLDRPEEDRGVVGRVLPADGRQGTRARHDQDRGPTQVAVDDRVVRLDLRITEYNFRRWRTRPGEGARRRRAGAARATSVCSTSTGCWPTCRSQPVEGQERRGHQGRSADRVLGAGAGDPDQPRRRPDLESDQGRRPPVRAEHELGSVRAPRRARPSTCATTRRGCRPRPCIGPWTAVTGKLPDSFSKLPADDNWKDVKAALPGQKLNAKTTPKVFVSTTPAELIVLEGPTGYVPVPGATSLLWVNNTESRPVPHGPDRRLLLPRRRALVQARRASTARGRSPRRRCRRTSRRSPLEHPRSRVLASVPGTPQATEAVVLASIPRTARVNKKELKAPDVAYQGEPQFTPIDGAQGRRAGGEHRQGHRQGRRPLLHVLPGRLVHVEARRTAPGKWRRPYRRRSTRFRRARRRTT